MAGHKHKNKKLPIIVKSINHFFLRPYSLHLKYKTHISLYQTYANGIRGVYSYYSPLMYIAVHVNPFADISRYYFNGSTIDKRYLKYSIVSLVPNHKKEISQSLRS